MLHTKSNSTCVNVLAGTSKGRIYRVRAYNMRKYRAFGEDERTPKHEEKLLARVPAPHGKCCVLQIEVSPEEDGEAFAAVATSNHGLYLLDCQTGHWLRSFAGHVNMGKPRDCVLPLTPGLDLLCAVGTDNVLRCWDLHTGQRLGKPVPLSALAAPGGRSRVGGPLAHAPGDFGYGASALDDDEAYPGVVFPTRDTLLGGSLFSRGGEMPFQCWTPGLLKAIVGDMRQLVVEE